MDEKSDAGWDGLSRVRKPPPPSVRRDLIEVDENGCVRITDGTRPTTAIDITGDEETTGDGSAAAVPAAAGDGSATAAAASGSTSAKEPPPSASTPLLSSSSYYASTPVATFGGHLDGPSVKAGNACEVHLLPRVQFSNGAVVVIEPDKFEIVVQDVVLAKRLQVPLTLAWALTIHKSQGMTLERAEINASGMFENGQLYVAVSRVKSLQGLRLRGFTRDCHGSHRRCLVSSAGEGNRRVDEAAATACGDALPGYE